MTLVSKSFTFVWGIYNKKYGRRGFLSRQSAAPTPMHLYQAWLHSLPAGNEIRRQSPASYFTVTFNSSTVLVCYLFTLKFFFCLTSGTESLCYSRGGPINMEVRFELFIPNTCPWTRYWFPAREYLILHNTVCNKQKLSQTGWERRNFLLNQWNAFAFILKSTHSCSTGSGWLFA